MARAWVFIFVCWVLGGQAVSAAEIYLKNGDKITGTITQDNGTAMVVQTVAFGEVKIDKSLIDLAKTYPSEPPVVQQVVVIPPVVWKKDMSLGYTQNGGNTKTQLGQFSTDINRKTASNETTAKFNANYSSTNGKMDGKKFYGMLRYAYSFGNDLKWYNFYKVEGDQDYFADLDYRVTASSGVGYWFSDTLDFKAMAELGLGFQYTSYRIESGPDEGGEPVLVPRFFIDKRLIGNLHLSEDFTFYPSLDDFRNYHFRSETDLINQLTERWSLKISYIDDFSSDPPVGFKKQDYIWATSLEYHF